MSSDSESETESDTYSYDSDVSDSLSESSSSCTESELSDMDSVSVAGSSSTVSIATPKYKLALKESEYPAEVSMSRRPEYDKFMKFARSQNIDVNQLIKKYGGDALYAYILSKSQYKMSTDSIEKYKKLVKKLSASNKANIKYLTKKQIAQLMPEKDTELNDDIKANIKVFNNSSIISKLISRGSKSDKKFADMKSTFKAYMEEKKLSPEVIKKNLKIIAAALNK